jgi:O-antigen ligase
MRVRPSARPIKRLRLGTFWVESTAEASGFAERVSGTALFFMALAATIGIGFEDPRLEYGYEFAVFVLAAIWCAKGQKLPLIPGGPLAAIAGWGFLQLALGTTVYRFATLQGSLRSAALGATFLVGFSAFGSRGLRADFLRALAWLGALIAVISVLAYFTSPGKILWMFDAQYPDIWGPFPSRNNFAQFLELAMPAALWLALSEAPGSVLYLVFGSIMLAAGLASASRAGALILLLEAITMLWMRRGAPQARRMALSLLVSTILFAAIPGVGTLVGRLESADPYQGRREIAHSTLEMIAARPAAGFGLGTFSTVYPAYAVFDAGKSVEHAHNDWLEWASEGGLWFALAWLGVAAWSVRPAWRAGWGIGVWGCFLHGLVDYPFARFGISAWILILLGMLARSDLREVRRRGH